MLQYRAGSDGVNGTENDVNCPIENALAWMDEGPALVSKRIAFWRAPKFGDKIIWEMYIK